jgi:hypothetical protein
MEAACNRFASTVLLISACLVSPLAKAGAISEPITGSGGSGTGGAGFTITGPDLNLSSGTIDWGYPFFYTEGKSSWFEIPASGSFQGVYPEGSYGTAYGVHADLLYGFLDFFSPSTSSVPIFSDDGVNLMLTLPVTLSGHIEGYPYSPDCAGRVEGCYDFGPRVFDIRLTGSGSGEFSFGGELGGPPTQWLFDRTFYVFTGTATLVPEPDSLWLAVIGLACIAWRFSSRKRRLLRPSSPGVRL